MTGAKRATILLSVAAVALAAAAAYGFGGGQAGPAQGGEPAIKTVEVTRMTLVDYEDASGEIGFGEVLPLRYPAPPASPPPQGQATPPPDGQPADQQDPAPPADDGLGLVTWLSAVGSTVDRGESLLRVDDEPVVLLFGALPLYRTLATGVTGADVGQFEQNLRDLGYAGFTVDEQYSAATAAVVRRWQKALGVAPTGTVAPGQTLYAAGPVRIAEHRLRVGDVAGGDVLGYTGSSRTVTAAVSTQRLRREITPGSPVSVVLPDGTVAPGTVRRVGPRQADDSQGGAESALQVEAEVTDPAALDGRQGAATLRFVVDERRDVLAVPVVALVALAEGGYGVQVADEASRRYVAVETGLFARGHVEITSGEVNAGTRVVVPA